jgi:hypothetical protein
MYGQWGMHSRCRQQTEVRGQLQAPVIFHSKVKTPGTTESEVTRMLTGGGVKRENPVTTAILVFRKHVLALVVRNHEF